MRCRSSAWRPWKPSASSKPGGTRWRARSTRSCPRSSPAGSPPRAICACCWPSPRPRPTWSAWAMRPTRWRAWCAPSSKAAPPAPAASGRPAGGGQTGLGPAAQGARRLRPPGHQDGGGHPQGGRPDRQGVRRLCAQADHLHDGRPAHHLAEPGPAVPGQGHRAHRRPLQERGRTDHLSGQGQGCAAHGPGRDRVHRPVMVSRSHAMRKLPRVLIVEDEPAIAELIAINLRHNGFQPFWAEDGESAQRELDAVLPEVILLDWMLPGQSGFSLPRKWRADSRTKPIPILMLTARGDEPDKVAGLDAGADDYITKPFSTQELLPPIRPVLRRRAPEQLSDSVHIGELRLDAATYRVTFQGQPLKVGPTEFKLLHFLMRHTKRVHSRTQLLDKGWGDHVYIEERTVDVHVKCLREALGAASVMVETVRGAGYRLTAQVPT